MARPRRPDRLSSRTCASGAAQPPTGRWATAACAVARPRALGHHLLLAQPTTVYLPLRRAGSTRCRARSCSALCRRQAGRIGAVCGGAWACARRVGLRGAAVRLARAIYPMCGVYPASVCRCPSCGQGTSGVLVRAGVFQNAAKTPHCEQCCSCRWLGSFGNSVVNGSY